MAPPVWLLDIDGVINAVSKKFPTNIWPADEWREVKPQDETGRVWSIKAARSVLEFLREVHEAGRAEIRWHTTWNTRALQVGRLLELPEFPVAEAPEFLRLSASPWWKIGAARRVLAEEGRDLLWTDDDAPKDLTAAERAELTGLGRLLIVSPTTSTGLRRKDLRQIDEFLTAHPPAS